MSVHFTFLADTDKFGLKSRPLAAVQSVVILDRRATGQVTHGIQQHKESPFLNLKKSRLVLIRSNSLQSTVSARNLQTVGRNQDGRLIVTSKT